MTNPCLEVVKALGLVTLQGRASYDRLHEGFPPSGPLVPALLDRANRRLGNPAGATGIEVCGEIIVRALREVQLATPHEEHALAAGEQLAITSGAQRVTYVAIASGVHAPHGLSYASLGELVRTGDRIDQDVVRELARGDATAADSLEAVEPIVRVIPGPDLDAFAPGALEHLTSVAWRISPTSNRVGTRLEGAAIARRAEYVEQSRPMALGAIEVPRDGAPIVLGPEHPTTGGYPLLAVIASESFDAFHAVRLGGSVRFRV